VALTPTGYFRTARIDGRWWLVDPDGHPFFSNGVNHVVAEGTVDRNGHAAYHEAILAKHGTEAAANNVAVRHRTDDDFGAPAPQLVCLVTFFIIEPDDLVAEIEQPPDERLARKACGACNENFHVLSPVVNRTSESWAF
jgi:hypothetical protein